MILSTVLIWFSRLQVCSVYRIVYPLFIYFTMQFEFQTLPPSDHVAQKNLKFILVFMTLLFLVTDNVSFQIFLKFLLSFPFLLCCQS